MITPLSGSDYHGMLAGEFSVCSECKAFVVRGRHFPGDPHPHELWHQRQEAAITALVKRLTALEETSKALERGYARWQVERR